MSLQQLLQTARLPQNDGIAFDMQKLLITKFCQAKRSYVPSKLRCGPDILDGDGDFLARRRVKSGYVVPHLVVRLDCEFFRRRLRRLRATSVETEKAERRGRE